MPPNTILILGAGPRVGWSVAQKFKAEGYKVAIGSRNPDITAATNAGFLPITVDLTNIQSVEAAFTLVTKSLGIPNVVVYNGEEFPIALLMTRFTKTSLSVAANLTFPKDPTKPFNSIDPETYVRDLNLNVVGAYVAIREAVEGFEQLDPEMPKAFIATGNVLPWQPLASGFTLGSGKAALVHLINVGAEAYKGSNCR